MSRQNNKIIFLIVLGLVLWYFASFTTAFFWIVFLTFVLFQLESTIVAQAALACLVLLPLLLATHKDAVAEQVAVYAYFLLAMTVALQIIELKRSGSKEPKNEPPPTIHPQKKDLPQEMAQKVKKVVMDILPQKKIKLKRKNETTHVR